jgi:SAM-dependent methyltransferase
MLQRTFFWLTYLRKPRWDTGIVPPELRRAVAGRPPGRAIDIGCGTGTNVRFLAESGWHVTGIDFVPRAISQARRKMGSLPATLLVADVTGLGELDLPGPFDLALDMGCYHSLPVEGRARYANGLRRWMAPGGLYMLYAWLPIAGRPGSGIPREEVEGAFAAWGFTLTGYEDGIGRPSAWYYFQKDGS